MMFCNWKVCDCPWWRQLIGWCEGEAKPPVDDGKCPHGWDRRMACSECGKAAAELFGSVDRSSAK